MWLGTMCSVRANQKADSCVRTFPLVGDGRTEHEVVRRNTVGRDQQQVAADLVQVSNLAAPVGGQAVERCFEDRRRRRQRVPRARSGTHSLPTTDRRRQERNVVRFVSNATAHKTHHRCWSYCWLDGLFPPQRQPRRRVGGHRPRAVGCADRCLLRHGVDLCRARVALAVPDAPGRPRGFRPGVPRDDHGVCGNRGAPRSCG